MCARPERITNSCAHATIEHRQSRTECWIRNRTQPRRPKAAVAETTTAEPAAGEDPTAGDHEVQELEEEEPEAPIVIDDLDGMSLEDAIDATIVAFDDGDLVHGQVVKIDSDEVLLDIGYKSEGVIPRKSSRSATTSTRTRS